MPNFWYSALTDGGTVNEVVLAAPSKTALADQLRRVGSDLIASEVRAKGEVRYAVAEEDGQADAISVRP